jgi:hypothetical protein
MSGQNIRNDKHFVLGSRVALTFSCERLLLAVSGLSKSNISGGLNVRFREKQTFRIAPSISFLMTTLVSRWS